jgi:cytochrome c peroxidase
MKIIVTSILAASVLMASSLVDTAKEAGLSAIPESQLELLKLIDNPKNPVTAEKVELGKKLYFDPRLSKSGLISCAIPVTTLQKAVMTVLLRQSVITGQQTRIT